MPGSLRVPAREWAGKGCGLKGKGCGINQQCSNGQINEGELRALLVRMCSAKPDYVLCGNNAVTSRGGAERC